MTSTTRAVALSRPFAVAVLGIAVFSLMDAVMKDLSLAMGTYTALFWRSLAGVVLSGAVYAASKPTRPTRAALSVHALRGAICAVMALCFFWGLARVPMAQAVALTFIAPLLSLYLSATLLHERVTRRMLTASAIALVGVVVIIAGQWHAGVRFSDASDETGLGTIAILASAVCYAFNITLMRKQALVSGPIEVAFAQSFVVAIVLTIGAPFAATWPDVAHVPILIGAAALATVSLMLLAWAYARGRANDLSASEYTSFVWAALFGYLFFGETVSWFTLVGAGCIVAGCVHVDAQRANDAGESGGCAVKRPALTPSRPRTTIASSHALPGKSADGQPIPRRADRRAFDGAGAGAVDVAGKSRCTLADASKLLTRRRSKLPKGVHADGASPQVTFDARSAATRLRLEGEGRACGASEGDERRPSRRSIEWARPALCNESSMRPDPGCVLPEKVMRPFRSIAHSVHLRLGIAAVMATALAAVAPASAAPVYLVGAQVYSSATDGSNANGPFQYSTNSSTSHDNLLVTGVHGSANSAIALQVDEGDNAFTFAFQTESINTPIVGLNLFFASTPTSFNPAFVMGVGAPGNLTVFTVAGSSMFGMPGQGVNVASFSNDGLSTSNTSYSGATSFEIGGESIFVTQFSATSAPSGSFTLTVRPTAVTGDPGTVPEPASLALLGIGIVGIGLSRRRRGA